MHWYKTPENFIYHEGEVEKDCPTDCEIIMQIITNYICFKLFNLPSNFKLY